MDITEPLQYGALGILLVVLVAIGAFLRSYLTNREERDAQAQELIHSLANQAISNQAKHAKAWMEMTRAGLTVQRQTIETLIVIKDGIEQVVHHLDEGEKRIAACHETLMAEIKGRE